MLFNSYSAYSDAFDESSETAPQQDPDRSMTKPSIAVIAVAESPDDPARLEGPSQKSVKAPL